VAVVQDDAAAAAVELKPGGAAFVPLEALPAGRARGTHPSAQSEVSRRGCRGTQTSQTLASRNRIPANFEESQMSETNDL
jgi:hypothetical protein